MPLPAPTPAGVAAIDVMEHYRFPARLDGRGRRIALIEFGGTFRLDELQIYCSIMGTPVPEVTDMAVGGVGAHADPQHDPKLAHDVQLLASAAPGAELILYRTRNTEGGIADAFAQATGGPDPAPTVLCVPWVIPEAADPQLTAIVEHSLRIAALRGMCVCALAAPILDGPGATVTGAPYPASSPHVLACGPSRALAGAAGVAGEAPVAGLAAGPAAASRLFPAPDWQRKRLGRGTRRRVLPDVTTVGDDAYFYRVFCGGAWKAIAGAGAPALLWAGLIARLAEGSPDPTGWFVDRLYRRLGPAGEVGPAGGRAGWQPGLGWGSPDGERLLAGLTRARR